MTPCYYCEPDETMCRECIHSNTYVDPQETIELLRAKVAELEAKLEKYENLEPVAYYTCQGNWPRIALAMDGNYDGYEIPLYALEMK